MKRLSRRLRTVGVGADIGMAVVLQVVGAVAAFAFQMVFTRTLSRDDTGLYFLALAYVTIGSGLADFGIVAVLFPRLSVARGEMTPAFKAALLLRMVTLSAALLLLNAYLMLTGRWELLAPVNVMFLSVVISSKATGIRQAFEVLWRLRGRTYVVTLVSVVDAVLALGAIAIVAYTHNLTLWWLTVIFTVSNLPGCIVVILPLLRESRANGLFRQRISPRYYKALIVAALPIAAMIVLGQTSAQLETLVIESYTAMSRADIAAYNAAIRPLTAMIFIATTLGFGLAPLVSQRIRGQRSDFSLEFITSVGVRILGVISVGICLVCWVFGEQIMHLFGAQYVQDAYILRTFSVISGLTFTVVMFDQFLLAMHKRKQTLMGAMLNFGLALATEPITIRIWGIRGMMYSKGLALCCLIAFQLSRFEPGMRRAAMLALLRLLPPAAALAGILYVTSEFGIYPRAAIALAVTAVAVLGLRTIGRAELAGLRALRVTQPQPEG